MVKRIIPGQNSPPKACTQQQGESLCQDLTWISWCFPKTNMCPPVRPVSPNIQVHFQPWLPKLAFFLSASTVSPWQITHIVPPAEGWERRMEGRKEAQDFSVEKSSEDDCLSGSPLCTHPPFNHAHMLETLALLSPTQPIPGSCKSWPECLDFLSILSQHFS